MKSLFTEERPKKVKFYVGATPCENAWQRNWQACNQMPRPNTF